jgi:hypothetical protein
MKDVTEGPPVEVGVLEQENVVRIVPKALSFEVGERHEVIAVKGIRQRWRVEQSDER